MHKIAILVKTYSGDLGYVERLIQSYHKHNRENIPLYIVASQAELSLFEHLKDEQITIIADEYVCTQLATEAVNGIRPGYINQEIIKLSFWELGLCENYFCVDSDGIFLRDFFHSDFMYDSDTPYTILVEDNELQVEPEYYRTYWESRKTIIRTIQDSVDLPPQRMLTSHGFSILSSKVLQSFKANFLDVKNKNYLSILREAPYEFSWYNMWLQKDKTIEIHIREPLFKCFHHKNQHTEYILRGVTSQDIARGYLGVVINSNYSRDFGIVSPEDDRLKVLAQYFSMSEISKIFFFKLRHLPKRILRKIKSKLFRNK